MPWVIILSFSFCVVLQTDVNITEDWLECILILAGILDLKKHNSFANVFVPLPYCLKARVECSKILTVLQCCLIVNSRFCIIYLHPMLFHKGCQAIYKKKKKKEFTKTGKRIV